MRSIRHRLACAGSILLCACATLPPHSQRDDRDPLERYNRAIYGFNRTLDRHIALPVARGYVKIVPQPMRHGVYNFLTNLSYPRTAINNALQGKLKTAGSDVARFTVNTVLGLGFFDPATSMGLELHDEDFGQTLGYWGVPSGPYFMLPVLGPSSIRDTAGLVPDEFTTPRHYINANGMEWGILALDLIDSRASLLDTEELLKRSYDEYGFVRSAWFQRRNYLVHDGDVPEESLEEPAP
jgi:phospholipid-binding lipoprotein MlaA